MERCLFVCLFLCGFFRFFACGFVCPMVSLFSEPKLNPGLFLEVSTFVCFGEGTF